MTVPTDAGARERAVSGRTRSLLVEASAGTGKTHAIVDVIEEVTVRREPRVPLTQVAAVTFTEKAAGELQTRIRERLVQRAAAGPDPARAAARAALEEIDRAQIGTIHAFCAALLRERPIEAGLVPGFGMLLPEASSAFARRVWEEWWRTEVDERPDGAVGNALRAGVKLVGGEQEETLSRLADRLYEKRSQIDPDRLPPADASTLLVEAGRLAARARALADADAGNPAAPSMREIAGWLESLPDDLEAIRRAAALAPTFRFRAGRTNEDFKRWREKEYRKFIDALAETEHWELVVDLLRRLVGEPGGYLDAVEKRKRRESLLDFDDLLLFARRLLAGSPAARRHFRDRYALIVVDEFQDTDPIQMEIVLRLAHEEGGGDAWETLRPEPGRLLLVGDPKQSIYRFRRADLETYNAVAGLFGADRETFVANRRSVPPILAWVNDVFGAALGPPVAAFQAAYSPVEPWGERIAPEGKRVVYLDPPGDWREDGERWRQAEARAIATFVADSVGRAGLPVGNEGRPARAGDVAVLVRSNDAIAPLQEAIAAVGLEAVIEGGVDFFRREEPAAVLAALRAIDNPDDRVALYAALKSFLFAFSDEELFLAREEGAEFDHRRASFAAGALREALDLLARLHGARDGRPASETLLELLAATGARVTARARRLGGLQAEANLVQLTSLARELESGASTFSAVVAGLSTIESADFSEPRAFEESRDAVRILTVHKAKGLEFPIVVVAGFGSTGRISAEGVLVPSRRGPWGASVKRGGDTLASPGFDAIRRADEEREKAELRRLLYVAATRAEDWLAVSRWRKITEGRDGPNDAFLRTGIAVLGPAVPGGRTAELVETRPELPAAPSRRARPSRVDESAAESLRREIREIEARPSRLSGTRSAPLRRAGGDAARTEDRPPSENVPAGEPSVAARVGCAVHRSMEMIERGGDPSAVVLRAALEWELGPRRRTEVAAMVERLRTSALFRTEGRRLPEFPVLFRSPEDGALVEGKIDLLIEGADGWTIVDYKTDRIDGLGGPAAVRAHFERYGPQLSEYAAALAILGVPVARACILSARTGEEFALPISSSSPPPPADRRPG